MIELLYVANSALFLPGMEGCFLSSYEHVGPVFVERFRGGGADAESELSPTRYEQISP